MRKLINANFGFEGTFEAADLQGSRYKYKTDRVAGDKDVGRLARQRFSVFLCSREGDKRFES